MSTEQRRLGFLADGQLFLCDGAGKEDSHTSSFVDGLRGRLQSIKDRNEWKSMGSGAQFMRGGLPTGGGAFEVDHFRAEFSSGAFHPADGKLVYAIDAGDVRGLFTYDQAESHEQRMLHGPKHRFASIDIRKKDEDSEEWLLAVMADDGTSRIGLLTPHRGGGVREITEGDSIDSYPVWIPGEARRFIYQTSGIARNRDGMWAGLGPAGLHMVDLDKGSMKTLLEDEHTDYLCPACGKDGEMYCLQRPYQPFRKPSLITSLKDIVLFPVRIVQAIFGFLNVFSKMFGGKSLTTAGAPKREGPDPKAVFLYGRWMNMEQMAREAPEDEAKSAVPKSWELRRRRKLDDAGELIASGVMAYALGSDGTVYYSDGRGVHALPPGGGPAVQVSKRRLVTHLFAS
ncbi:hypothetical protein [Roseimicrobium sp. ORNL1]|uniref:hypothetical protein n=1 Tax=Roseimicrobium sp. ORNL1 TaxID=2711231 RepID=UPI0013E1E936|nr:hypothetical protein [Roseimicrobium sp. ORNL1]QIF04100.1 hypothetical protein G5S37_22080 [Roseimicrobium sp. ORNL1]